MIKELLRRVLGKSTVNYVELETILCDCEATINSRPLTYISDEVDSLRPLTPASFLQTIPQNEVPDLDNIDSTSCNKRLRYIQKLRKDLRSRFRSEYLALLVHQGSRKDESLRVGDVVLVGSDEKRVNWPLGLVMETFPGADGHARVARVKTSNGERIRPFQRLYLMEMSEPPQKSPEMPKETIPSKDDVVQDTVISKLKETVTENPTRPIVTRLGRTIKVPSRLNL